MYDFNKIAAFLPFFSQAFNSNAEILLCDTEKIIYVHNPLTGSSKVGAPIGEMERSFIEDKVYNVQDSVFNYRALLADGKRLRASTMFLKDENGQLAGLLTVNLQIEDLLKMRDLMDFYINGSSSSMNESTPAHGTHSRKKRKPSASFVNRYEQVNVAIKDIIQTVTDQFLSIYGISVDRLTASERIQIVCELDKQGVFLVKGSISEVAQKLNCSEATVYRYLQQLS